MTQQPVPDPFKGIPNADDSWNAPMDAIVANLGSPPPPVISVRGEDDAELLKIEVAGGSIDVTGPEDRWTEGCARFVQEIRRMLNTTSPDPAPAYVRKSEERINWETLRSIVERDMAGASQRSKRPFDRNYYQAEIYRNVLDSMYVLEFGLDAWRAKIETETAGEGDSYERPEAGQEIRHGPSATSAAPHLQVQPGMESQAVALVPDQHP